jgi:putative inorganic carbon (HCO3(-)) transporter
VTGPNIEFGTRVGRGWRAVIIGLISVVVGTTAAVAGARPSIAVVLLSATALGAIAFVAATRFELLTLAMVAGRTAIDLAHDGSDDGLLRLSVVITGGYTLIALAWLLINRIDRPLRFSPVAKCAAILTSATLLSGFLSPDPAQALTGASRWVFLTVFVVVLENLVTDHRAVRRLLYSVALSTVVPLAVGTWQLIEGQGRLSDGISRVDGSFSHPNTYGFYLVVVALLLIAIIRNLPRRVIAPTGFLLVAVIINLVATYSRTSYVAFVVGLLAVGLAARRWLLLSISVAAIAAATFIPAVQVRFSDLGDPATVRGTPGNSLAWRVDYWDDVLAAGEGRRVTGLGFGVVSDVTAQQREPHNDFLRSFVELGAIGLIAYLSLLAAIAWQLRVATQRTLTAKGPSGLPRSLVTAQLGVFAAYLIGSSTGNLMTQLILLWYVFAVGVAASLPARLPDVDLGDAGRPIRRLPAEAVSG